MVVSIIMLKMFSTQLSGVFKRLQENEEMAMEDSARLLAQASIGSGKVYIFATKEMKAIAFEAAEGAEPLNNAYQWTENQAFAETDRFLIVTRYATDIEAMKFGQLLVEKGIPFAAISTDNSNGNESIADLADAHIDLKLLKGLLPDENGNRIGYPSSMTALFVYYGIKFIYDEIIAEYE